MVIQKIKKAIGQIKVPGDKSISHRAVMLGSLANGVTEISGFLKGADCLSTIDCFRKMGIDIDINGENVTVHGNGLRGLKSLMKCFIQATAVLRHVFCAVFWQVKILIRQLRVTRLFKNVLWAESYNRFQ